MTRRTLAPALCLLTVALALCCSGTRSRQLEEPLISDFTPPTGRGAGAFGIGPWIMRLMSATSADGLVFNRTNQVITDQGDVPDLVQDARGWIYLYYVGWTVGSERNRLVVAISRDEGRNWVYKKTLLEGFEGMSDPVDPDVQILPDGTFRLYVTASSLSFKHPRTYYAESADGSYFMVYVSQIPERAPAPVAAELNFIPDPGIRVDNASLPKPGLDASGTTYLYYNDHRVEPPRQVRFPGLARLIDFVVGRALDQRRRGLPGAPAPDDFGAPGRAPDQPGRGKQRQAEHSSHQRLIP